MSRKLGAIHMKTGETVALLLATGAFFSSFYHFYTQRKHQKISVKPYFQISSNFDSVINGNLYTLRVKLKNVGLGPGIVTEKVMKLGEITTSNVHDEFEEWVKLVNRVTPANGNAECRTARCEPDYAIDRGESIDLLVANFPKNNISFMDARDIGIGLAEHIEISVKYKSHYGESYQCAK